MKVNHFEGYAVFHTTEYPLPLYLITKSIDTHICSAVSCVRAVCIARKEDETLLLVLPLSHVKIYYVSTPYSPFLIVEFYFCMHIVLWAWQIAWQITCECTLW